MLVSSENERQTLRFSWSHLSEERDRVELTDALGLRSIILIKDADRYYQENTMGQRILLSANTLEEPLASVLSSLPSDIARLMTGAKSADNRVTSEVVVGPPLTVRNARGVACSFWRLRPQDHD